MRRERQRAWKMRREITNKDRLPRELTKIYPGHGVLGIRSYRPLMMCRPTTRRVSLTNLVNLCKENALTKEPTPSKVRAIERARWGQSGSCRCTRMRTSQLEKHLATSCKRDSTR